MASAQETYAKANTERVRSFYPTYVPPEKKLKILGTILACAGFVWRSDQKVICPDCHFKPDLEKIRNISSKNSISTLFLVILEHVSHTELCITSKLCFLTYFSKETLNEINLNECITSKQKYNSGLNLESDCKQRYRTDGHELNAFKLTRITPFSIYDNLSFESLSKRCQDSTNMKSAEARLLTFKDWRFSHLVLPLALACDGFYKHDGKQNKDSVKCTYCGLVLNQWEANDVVSIEHINNSPNCPFKMRRFTDDISLNDVEVYYHRCILMFASEQFDEKVLKADQDFNSTVKEILDLFSNRDNLMLTNNRVFSKLSEIDRGEYGAVGGRLEFDSVNSHCSEVGREAKRSIDRSSIVSEEDVQKEISKISEENARLRETKLCKICIDKDIDTVFLPCGHLVSCRGCAPKIRSCAVCRTLIRGTVLAFIPND